MAVRSDPDDVLNDTDEVLAVLSRPEDDDLADLVALAAAICDCQSAGITIRRGDEYHVPITYGIEPLVCASDDTFCIHTMSTDGVFCIEDASNDARFQGIAWVDGSVARTKFYASAPVHAPSGMMVGRLCVIDPEPKILTDLQVRMLEALGLSVTKVVALRLMLAGRPATAATRISEAAATVMSQLAAELSHDLRVPLSTVIASVEMLEERLADHPDRAIRALLDRSTRAADRMLRMLDQNLRSGGGRNPPTHDAVDLGTVVEQLALDSATLLESVGARVEADWLPVVHADPDDVYSVLQNLLTNSVKFTRPGVPAVVRVSSRRTDHGWRISVRDNGIGIPEGRRVDVFALFSRVDTDVAGHGIGLATVARIVASYGGRAGAVPTPEGGTEIWFDLPDEQPNAAVSPS